MFGTLGFSELIIILAIILIIFGAGRLPQIGEGLGRALKGFKKEVHEVPPPDAAPEAQQPAATEMTAVPDPQGTMAAATTPTQPESAPAAKPPAGTPPEGKPYVPGPEMTPGTTASVLVSGLAPQPYQPPKPKAGQPHAASPAAAAAGPHIPTMEERLAQPPPQPRGSYPPVPPAGQPKPAQKRPSAVVNKEAVARVQAQQAALRTKAAPTPPPNTHEDMQRLGESLGDALRTFRQAAVDVRSSVDPQMRTIQAEMEAAQKELQQSIEAAKQMPAVQEDEPPKPS